MSGAAAARPQGDVPVPLTGPALMIAGVCLALANFMVVLDTTIVNVSVPHIAGGLAVSPSEGTWAITSYSVAEAITVPLTGWLAQRFGTVKTFCVAMTLFALCSALCGLAPSLSLLVLFRVMQGLSGGPMIPLCQTLLLRVFPKERAAAAIGLWSMTTVTAPIAGPIVGGYLCDDVNWPSIFYINVPVALLCAFLVWRLLQSRETKTVRLPVDMVGMGLLVVWIGALQIMLDKGQELDWFNSSFIVGLGLTAVIGFFCFLIWELTHPNPIVNLRVFRHRGFAVSTVTLALTFGTFFTSAVLLPLWLQTSMNYTATMAGLAVGTGGILAVIMSPVVARLVTKVDPRALVCFGILWLGMCSWLRSCFDTDVDIGVIALVQFIQGFALPFFFVPIVGLGLSAVEPHEVASAAGLSNFCRTTAAAFAASLSITAWEDSGTSARTNLSGLLNGPNQLMDQLVGRGFDPEQARGVIDNQVQVQSTMLGTNQVFFWSAILFVGCAMLVWMAPKPKRVVKGGGGH
jgi:DHA2 family multidrug resistance protein